MLIYNWFKLIVDSTITSVFSILIKWGCPTAIRPRQVLYAKKAIVAWPFFEKLSLLHLLCWIGRFKNTFFLK